jgi:quinol monooxygenase YgiN
MINEIVVIAIDPANARAFEAAVAKAAPLFRAAEGCHSMALERGIEDPAQYRLLVEWETMDHHMIGFRGSDAFQQWRALAGVYFAAPVIMSHSATVEQYF